MGYVYKITNDVNEKIYIGKTELANPHDRWKEHLSDYIKERNANRPLYKAMKKYGSEHFHFEVIEETNDTCEREKYWIDSLRTYVGFKDCKGYNATLGGDGKSYLQLNEEEVIKYHTEEAFYVLTDTSKHFCVDKNSIRNILIKNHVFWCPASYSSRRKTYLEYGGVIQVDTKSKIILQTFENARQAAKELGLKNATGINDACTVRKSHFSNGYLWYYGKDIKEAIEKGAVIDPNHYDFYEKYKDLILSE